MIDRMIGWFKQGIEKMVPQPDAHVSSKTDAPVEGAVRIHSPSQQPIVGCDASVLFPTAASAPSELPAAAIPADTEQ